MPNVVLGTRKTNQKRMKSCLETGYRHLNPSHRTLVVLWNEIQCTASNVYNQCKKKSGKVCMQSQVSQKKT